MTEIVDKRPVSLLLRQWSKLDLIKRSLIAQNKLTATATPPDVVEALRKEMPTHIFSS